MKDQPKDQMIRHYRQKQNILLILHNHEKDLYQVYTIMDTTVSYLLMLQKYSIESKKLFFETKKDYTLCLGNISKDFTISNMKKAGLKGVVILFLLISILLILTMF